jgi:class 3 adenylate cyclase
MRQLSKLRHPCITTIMGAVISSKHEPMLVMEYMEAGSLYDLLHNESMPIDGELLLPILRDVSQGVRFLHAASPIVIHGDLKAQNVLVDSKYRAKVADFGLTQKKQIGATGTPLWMAPELLRGESENNAMTDVYSFGIILYEAYSRKDPYFGENHLDVLRQVVNPKINKRPGVPEGCPQCIVQVMTDCLVAIPDHRLTFEELDLRLKRFDVESVEPLLALSKQQKKEAAQVADRNQSLLFDVFPRHIAEILREGRKVEAESFECTTVFFSDIVGYTTICTKLPARKVSNMLDRLYDAFDAIADRLEVFKIDTIGDAYMCVTNLSKNQPDHAVRMARFSVEAMHAANQTLINVNEPSLGCVQIRVCFHSGPLVADVVGTRCPKYTLFGDTVNTASRMESNALPGRIQCSERSAGLIAEQDPVFPIVSRGKIHIKGKGDMHTFWVNEDGSVDKLLAAEEEEKKKKRGPKAAVNASVQKPEMEKLDSIFEGSQSKLPSS